MKEESRVTSFLLLQSILLLFSLTESIAYVYKQRKTPVRKSSYSPLLRCVGRLQSTQGIALHHVQVHLGSDCDDDHVKVRRDGDLDADVDRVQLIMMVST